MLPLKLSKQQLEAFARLRGPELAPVLDAFRELEQQTQAALAKADDSIMIYRLQGRLSCVSGVLQIVMQSNR